MGLPTRVTDKLFPQTMVREFHEVYGAVINPTPTLVDEQTRELRKALMLEELHETLDAMDAAQHKHDLVEIADGLADLIYVVYGTAISYGIDLDAVVREVHRSNLSKLGADGKPIYRADGKVLKGPGYSPPDIARVLGIKRPQIRPGGIEG